MDNVCFSRLISKTSKRMYCPEIIPVVSRYNQSTIIKMLCSYVWIRSSFKYTLEIKIRNFAIRLDSYSEMIYTLIG